MNAKHVDDGTVERKEKRMLTRVEIEEVAVAPGAQKMGVEEKGLEL